MAVDQSSGLPAATPLDLATKRSESRVAPIMGSVALSRPDERSAVTRLLDHLVGGREQRRGHCEAECLRRDQIDDELELAGAQNRNISRLLPLEHAPGIDSDLAMQFGKARPIAHQPAGLRPKACRINRGHCVSRRQGDDLEQTVCEQWLSID